MKNFLKLTIVFVIAAGTFTSCKKDESTPPPVLKFIEEAGFTYQDAGVAPGDSVKVGFVCTSNGSDALASLKFYVNEQQYLNGTFEVGIQEFTTDGFWLIKSAADEDNWTFELVDINGNTSSLTLKLTKDLAKADVEDITGVVLGAQDNNTDKPMYSITDKATYNFIEATPEAIQAKIDFVCYSDIKNNTYLSSPGANWTGTNYEVSFNAWTTKNVTYFILDAPFELAEYEVLTKTKIKTAYDDAVEAALPDKIEIKKSKDMAPDKMYLFKTYNGKYGVIKVNTVTPGTTGSVNFDIKIEK